MQQDIQIKSVSTPVKPKPDNYLAYKKQIECEINDTIIQLTKQLELIPSIMTSTRLNQDPTLLTRILITRRLHTMLRSSLHHFQSIKRSNSLYDSILQGLIKQRMILTKTTTLLYNTVSAQIQRKKELLERKMIELNELRELQS